MNHNYETIAVETPTDGMVHLQLNRRRRLNAINAELLDELEDALRSILPDEATRALLLSGRGRAFSIGADVRDSTVADRSPLEARALSRRGGEVFGLLRASSIPVIACVDGYCLGGGMELAAWADCRIATPASTFGLPEVGLGLLPGWGGTQLLPRLVGAGTASIIVLSGEEFDAETMADYGFVTELADDPVERGLAVADWLESEADVSDESP